MWAVEDRQKMQLIKEQHPDLDIRMVFNRSASPIRKGSKTTYADICEKLGIPYADKVIPIEWLNEPANPKAAAALDRLIIKP